jgi:hypothetical protein
LNSGGSRLWALPSSIQLQKFYKFWLQTQLLHHFESWIGFAVDLHMALHSSSPVSNQKDAPTWLLEWIDAGVVYQRNGARGFLRYSAILDEVGGGREQWPRTRCGAV